MSAGYGTASGDAGGGDKADKKEGGDPAWVVTLRDATGAGPASSERLDVAKFVFIILVCSGHFMEPFYKIGNKPTTVFMHIIYGRTRETLLVGPFARTHTHAHAATTATTTTITCYSRLDSRLNRLKSSIVRLCAHLARLKHHTFLECASETKTSGHCK